MSLLRVALRSPAFCCVNPLGEGALGFCFRAALAFAGAAEGDVPRHYRTAGLWRAPRPRAARDPPSSSLRPSPTRTRPPLQFRPSLLALPLLSDVCCFCCCVRCCCVCCCVCCCCCRVVVVVGASVARSTRGGIGCIRLGRWGGVAFGVLEVRIEVVVVVEVEVVPAAVGFEVAAEVAAVGGEIDIAARVIDPKGECCTYHVKIRFVPVLQDCNLEGDSAAVPDSCCCCCCCCCSTRAVPHC